jgi:hypothetical protein
LSASGSTAGSKGIRTAYNIAEKYFIEGGNNRVILATDGDFNVGLTVLEDLENFVARKRKSGVYFSVFGFGYGNIKSDKMETLALNGNGTYSYIDSLNEARRALVTNIGGTMLTVAKDVKAGITFNPDSQMSVDKHKALLDVADLFLLDIKHIDDKKCDKLTWHGNKNTLAFARFLSDNNKPMWIRQVLVPGYTDDEEDLKKTRAFIDSLNSVEHVEVLPYHTMGTVKYEKLKIVYPLKGVEAPSKEKVAYAKRILTEGRE